MKVNSVKVNEIAYSDPPIFRVVTLFWFTNQDYPPGLATACRPLFLRAIYHQDRWI